MMRPKLACRLEPGDYIGERHNHSMILMVLPVNEKEIVCYLEDGRLTPPIPIYARLMVWGNEIEQLQREAARHRAEMARRLREFDEEFLRVQRQRRLESCVAGGWSEPAMADMLEKRRRLWAQLRAALPA